MAAPQLAIVTSGRIDQVETCLASYLAASPTSPAGVLVLDDSRESNHIPADYHAVWNIARRAGLPIRYLSRADRLAYIALLAGRGIPRHVAEFCLLGPGADWFTAGANRNAALLDMVGENMLMVDDDTRGATAGSSLAGEWTIAGNSDPTDIQVFSSRQQAYRAALWQETDLIGDAARVLRSRPAGAQDGTVRVVACGVVGDSGFFSPAHLLWNASAKTTAQLRKSQELLAIALSSREVIRMASQPALTRGSVCMATVIGLDNIDPLPPFLPAGRNEDGFFGNLLWRCFPRAWTAHVPCAIIHAAPEGRRYERLPDQKQSIRLSELLIILLATCPGEETASPSTVFLQLARHLRQISRSPGDFETYAREAVRVQRQHLLSGIRRQVHSGGESSALWRRQIASFAARLQELVASPDCWMPAELLPLGPGEALEQTLRLVRLTGDLLEYWPNLVEMAHDLRTAGQRLSRPFP